MKSLKKYANKGILIFKSNPTKWLLMLGLIIAAKMTFADDALSAAEPIVKDTYNGSIKTYLYVGEGVAAVLTLIFTRNIKTLGGVGAVAIFLNIVTALAGI